MPLMNDWCVGLVRTLRQLVHFQDAASLLGLVDEGGNPVDGEAFEIQLGRFLSWRLAAEAASKLTAVGVNSGQNTDQIDGWFRQAKLNGDQIFDVINKSLSDEFGPEQIDQYAARDAYRGLFDACGVHPGIPVAVATTNYDIAAELALSQLDRRPDWGASTGVHNNPLSTPVDVTGMAAEWGAYRAPVLHLHGRVGWYIDENNQLMSGSPSQGYQPQVGLPGLLLPDPNKDYSDLPAVDAMWVELEHLINRGAKVLVVGHSLHDQRLVDILGRYGQRVGVTYYSRPQVDTGEGQREVERITQILPTAITIPVRFGPEFWTDPQRIRPWIDASS